VRLRGWRLEECAAGEEQIRLRARRPRLGRRRGWRGRRWGGRRLERRPKVRLEGRGRAQTEEEAQEPQEERGAGVRS